MTILRYITQDGRMIEEKTRINERYIEERDGLHPMTNDCVFQDGQRRKDNSILIAEGVTTPIFSKLGHQDMENFFREYVVAESKFKQPTISKIWKRTFLAISDWIMSYGIYLGVVVLILGSIVATLWPE